MNKPDLKRLGCGALLLATLLLTACAAPLQPSTGVTCPPPPAIPQLPPSLKVPPPQESFLEAALKDIEDWQKKLTASETR